MWRGVCQLVLEMCLCMLPVLSDDTHFVPKYMMKVKLIKYWMPNILSEKIIHWENGEQRKAFNQNSLMQLFNGDRRIVQCLVWKIVSILMSIELEKSGDTIGNSRAEELVTRDTMQLWGKYWRRIISCYYFTSSPGRLRPCAQQWGLGFRQVFLGFCISIFLFTF